MCSILPAGIPIAFGIIILPATSFNIVFFNFLNQTYNALVNLENSSGGSKSHKIIAINYTLALVTSLSVGLLLKRFFLRRETENIISQICIRILPSSIAGACNLIFMRSNYVTKGINVKTDDGEVVGQSKICGFKALLQGVLTRIALPLPLMINFFVMKRLDRYKLSKTKSNIIEVLLCSIALGIGMPMSLGLSRQNDTINIRFIEKDIVSKLNQEIKYLNYDKGL